MEVTMGVVLRQEAVTVVKEALILTDLLEWLRVVVAVVVKRLAALEINSEETEEMVR
jgi:hypothetical protein